MPFVLATVAKSCNLRCNYLCWVFVCSSILTFSTVNLHTTIMEQTPVPTYAAQVWCPVSWAPVYWTRISKMQIQTYSFPTIPSKHSKVFTLQISQRCGCISSTRTMIFLNVGSSIALLSFYSLQKRPYPWRTRDLFHSCDLAHHEICISMVSHLNFLRMLLIWASLSTHSYISIHLKWIAAGDLWFILKHLLDYFLEVRILDAFTTGVGNY